MARPLCRAIDLMAAESRKVAAEASTLVYSLWMLLLHMNA